MSAALENPLVINPDVFVRLQKSSLRPYSSRLLKSLADNDLTIAFRLRRERRRAAGRGAMCDACLRGRHLLCNDCTCICTEMFDRQ